LLSLADAVEVLSGVTNHFDIIRDAGVAKVLGILEAVVAELSA
jgi:hypothetical protein